MKRKVLIVLLVFIQVLAIAWAVVPSLAEDALLVPTQKPRPTQRPRPTRKPRGTLVPTDTPEPPCEVIVSEGIGVDTTWQADCTYIANGGIYVLSGAALTIPEGVTVLIGSWMGVFVDGTLAVVGTESNPVIIRRLYEDLSWTGIHIQSASMPPSDLTYLEVKGSYGGIRVVSGEVWITNVAIEGWRPFGGI